MIDDFSMDPTMPSIAPEKLLRALLLQLLYSTRWWNLQGWKFF
jgi:hypothetical protein